MSWLQGSEKAYGHERKLIDVYITEKIEFESNIGTTTADNRNNFMDLYKNIEILMSLFQEVL